MKKLFTVTVLALLCMACSSDTKYQDEIIGTWVCDSSINGFVKTKTYSTYKPGGSLSVYAMTEGKVSSEELSDQFKVSMGDKAVYRTDYEGTWSIDGAVVIEEFNGDIKLTSINDVAKKFEDRTLAEIAEAFSSNTPTVDKFKILNMDSSQMKIRRLATGRLSKCNKEN